MEAGERRRRAPTRPGTSPVMGVMWNTGEYGGEGIRGHEYGDASLEYGRSGEYGDASLISILRRLRVITGSSGGRNTGTPHLFPY